jgi:hypothetical protein
MVEPLRHRQTKGAATDMFDLQPPRHIPTLPEIGIGGHLAVPPLPHHRVAITLGIAEKMSAMPR